MEGVSGGGGGERKGKVLWYSGEGIGVQWFRDFITVLEGQRGSVKIGTLWGEA